MNDYLFHDNYSGEYFYVQADTRKEATAIARQYFRSPRFISLDPPAIAEMSGYDTY
jgi:hypothetical protein